MVGTWPAVQEFGSHFMADARPSGTQPPAGDFLQSNYELWLVGHQLENGHAPWLDPYSFQPEVPPRVNFPGWPFGLPYWPAAAAFGPVVAWNLLVFLSIVGAGLLVCAWLRELEVGRGAALAGGLAFALAPYRLEQSAGHVLGIIAVFLPLALWAFERGRRGSSWWFPLSIAALASIPLSGQVNLALGAVPFFALYALVRSRRSAALVATAAAVLASVAAGLLVQEVAIVGSIGEGGRSLDEVRVHSTRVSNFVSRDPPLQREQFVYLGWATLILGAFGLAALLAKRRWGLAAVLTGGFLIPALLALGTNLPSYSWLWHALPPLRYPRVPERLLPIACLCLAALVAFAAGWGRSRLVLPALVVALLFVDLRVPIFRPVSSDEANSAYAALGSEPPGRLLELPVFLPGQHFGSVYLYYEMQAGRERPGGYSPLAPRDADRMARRLRPLNCGDWSLHSRALERLGVRYIAVYTGLYEGDVPVNRYCAPIALHALETHGFRLIGSSTKIRMFAVR